MKKTKRHYFPELTEEVEVCAIRYFMDPNCLDKPGELRKVQTAVYAQIEGKFKNAPLQHDAQGYYVEVDEVEVLREEVARLRDALTRISIYTDTNKSFTPSQVGIILDEVRWITNELLHEDNT